MTFNDEHELQARLIYSIIVAGKNANFADKAIRKLLLECAKENRSTPFTVLPFNLFGLLNELQLRACVIRASTGNYNKLCRAIRQIIAANLNLETVTPEELEGIQGIGHKTSRFFIIWTRPYERYAALDVHVLRYLKELGYDVPRSTPSNDVVYRKIEGWFLSVADGLGITPRELDKRVWEKGAGRTQETALP